MADQQFMKTASVPLIQRDVEGQGKTSTEQPRAACKTCTIGRVALLLTLALLAASGAILALRGAPGVSQDLAILNGIPELLGVEGPVMFLSADEPYEDPRDTLYELWDATSCTLSDNSTWTVSTSPSSCAECQSLCVSTPSCTHMTISIDGRVHTKLTTRQDIMEYQCATVIVLP